MVMRVIFGGHEFVFEYWNGTVVKMRMSRRGKVLSVRFTKRKLHHDRPFGLPPPPDPEGVLDPQKSRLFCWWMWALWYRGGQRNFSSARRVLLIQVPS